MACPQMALEAEFLEVLQQTDNYFSDGKVLTLNQEKMVPLAIFEASYTAAQNAP